MAEEELTDADWRTLCDSSETARVVGAARDRRAKVLGKIERRLQTT